MKVKLTKWANMVASLSLLSAKMTTNQACGYFYYQREIPEKAKKLRKF